MRFYFYKFYKQTILLLFPLGATKIWDEHCLACHESSAAAIVLVAIIEVVL